MQMPDYYAILQVASNATPDEIKRAYRRLARQYHPDLHPDAEEDRMRAVNEAYAVLSDMSRRTVYDIQRLEELRRITILEALVLQQKQRLREQQMTWRDGMVGFVRELKKELRS